jgi:predicted nucleic-acid-binding Zn-ribbon protein
MKNATCRNCGSNEVPSNLRIHGGDGHPPFVRIHEPEKRPFVWIPKTEHSQFRASTCGACGYTEFFSENHVALNEGYKKGYTSS